MPSFGKLNPNCGRSGLFVDGDMQGRFILSIEEGLSIAKYWQQVLSVAIIFFVELSRFELYSEFCFRRFGCLANKTRSDWLDQIGE